jgi:hypothetical protein
MKLNISFLFCALSIFAGFLVMLHQKLTWGKWFEIEDLHHETFVLIFFAFALGIFFNFMISRNSKQKY